MWLIEFVGGHLHGVTLPLDSSLEITGNKESKNLEALIVPESLPMDITLLLELNGAVPVLKGFNKSRQVKRLVANRVYCFKGLSFFLFKEGSRRPSLRRYRFREYRALIISSLLLNILLTGFVFFLFQMQEKSVIVGYLQQLGSGYLKEGKLYVFDEKSLAGLPTSWLNHINLVSKDDYLQASQLTLELVSASSGKPLVGKLIQREGRDQIQVETNEIDNRVMALLGQYGLDFKKKGNDWFVSNHKIATQLLREAGLHQVLSHVKPREGEAEIIDEKAFPYSIFYSTTAGRYLYNSMDRYWEGSEVPLLGVIQSINPNKVVFKNGLNTRIYLIKK
ncbi:hypothetical protein CCZ37_07350 [Vibrio qinghaiensis]|uniref:Uncharacterized protein n=1 Tax=Vibrio qinghaiensis TaxID=2025808 RepID=A0A223MYJ4_9VIBR|nr:hypothetical protein [Vibrio qinghaiensis]ASU22417.1 hypothetical protein CCZ37_07350 [Vibrio qinghaiensis]